VVFASFQRGDANERSGSRRRESLAGSVRRGSLALQDLLRLRRARMRLRVERLLLVGGGTAALVVAAGAALAAAVVLVVVGAALGIAGATGLPAWAGLAIGGGLLGVLVVDAVRVATRRWRLSEWPEHRATAEREETDERTIAAEERIAREGLSQSADDAVHALTSPVSLAAAFGVGFLGTRVLRRHPWLLRTLVGLAGVGWRRRRG
jgi:hypothetical protein